MPPRLDLQIRVRAVQEVDGRRANHVRIVRIGIAISVFPVSPLVQRLGSSSVRYVEFRRYIGPTVVSVGIFARRRPAATTVLRAILMIGADFMRIPHLRSISAVSNPRYRGCTTVMIRGLATRTQSDEVVRSRSEPRSQRRYGRRRAA